MAKYELKNILLKKTPKNVMVLWFCVMIFLQSFKVLEIILFTNNILT